MTQLQADHKRAQQKRAQEAKQRRLQGVRERHRREQAQAQRPLQALEQAVQELGLPATIAAEVRWRLRAQQQLLGKIVGMMFPPGVWVSHLL